MTTTRLSTMPYAQATVCEENGNKYLVSYATHVATVTPDGWLIVYGLYSMTTRRHIRAFVNENCNTYIPFDTIKTLVTERLAMNLETGEIRPVSEIED